MSPPVHDLALVLLFATLFACVAVVRAKEPRGEAAARDAAPPLLWHAIWLKLLMCLGVLGAAVLAA